MLYDQGTHPVRSGYAEWALRYCMGLHSRSYLIIHWGTHFRYCLIHLFNISLPQDSWFLSVGLDFVKISVLEIYYWVCLVKILGKKIIFLKDKYLWNLFIYLFVLLKKNQKQKVIYFCLFWEVDKELLLKKIEAKREKICLINVKLFSLPIYF